MNIYISSSWKNREKVREMAERLAAMGNKVYDFTDPRCRNVPEIPPERFPDEYDPETTVYSEYIQRPEWRAAVTENRKAIEQAELIVLLLPCGNDSHADWALGVGMGKRSIVVGRPHKGERSPVHMWADAILDSPDDLYELANIKSLSINERASEGMLDAMEEAFGRPPLCRTGDKYLDAKCGKLVP